MRNDLERGFDDLLASEDRQRSGYQFQRWLKTVLLEAGFEVHTNPQIAKPRQTDLVARHAGDDYLIEAKFRQAIIDIADVDALRSRLGRTPSDIVGCIFSLSDYSSEAIKGVAENRTREILLFNAAEIQNLARSPNILSGLIEKKRANLRLHGRVTFVDTTTVDSEFPIETQLPASELQFQFNGNSVPFVPAVTDNMDIVFTGKHLDPSGDSDDLEFLLRLDLDVRQLPDLRHVAGLLNNSLNLLGGHLKTGHRWTPEKRPTKPIGTTVVISCRAGSKQPHF